ncbi:heme-degrading domain-containing protein [Duganella qianjiadongensis]|uniref:Heme-degrading domain-containing protein n=1 Tax=Duganella qianjiadongensis TaxID=2692176 RepID=A0ABW9VRG5_9BURK|nr:heme-degrading domain-containing protein [Duganella qianjiadongensis]MYM41821.1 heme-degrading domain-containing protein [Duganella qianjiadongensis]
MENELELLAALAQQENALQFTTFSSDTALALGLKVIELARYKQKSITVQISVNGKLLFQHAMQGATADQADWIRRKSNVVLRFGRSSYAVGCDYRQRGVAFDQQKHLPAEDYAAFGGAFPILLRGSGMIGTAAVSGLRQAEDHALLVEALQAVLN